jgi:hypothetical protein
MRGQVGAQDVGQHERITGIAFGSADYVAIAIPGHGQRVDRKDHFALTSRFARTIDLESGYVGRLAPSTEWSTSGRLLAHVPSLRWRLATIGDHAIFDTDPASAQSPGMRDEDVHGTARAHGVRGSPSVYNGIAVSGAALCHKSM